MDSTFRLEATVSTSILSYAECLHYGFDSEQVTVNNQLLFRGKTKHIPIYMPWLIYWKHKGLKDGNVDSYRYDKVHLNGFGMEC